ncbi:hypothetical protein FGADI_3494 [Fusarium gaditjirri]|uniref:Uncharacterized protein n=1 Tax=Fusarium gaditjirri TaxID=282569 RepID=A0A8H4TFL4_9HYPO|nr:hypothetical protein FGADI_3494 [Fusarium gaditjirri]
MKSKAAPTSALNLAVEAFALANARKLMSCSGSLAQMALSRYGAALATVRDAITRHVLTADDDMLMAILIIDMFEVVFMVREEPLKLHDKAIEYLLSARGTKQVESVTGRAIYRMANHRLQLRQLGLGLEPLPVQLACAKILDQSTPAHSLGKIQLGAQQTLAISRYLLYSSSSGWEDLLCLFFQIQVHLSEFEQWKIDLSGSWKPKRVHLAEHNDVLELLIARSVPCTQYVLIYEDPVITHQMAFFYQGQLALRSALLDAMTEMKSICPDQFTIANLEQEIDTQYKAIYHSVGALVESVTPLLGSIDIDETGSISLTGKKIALCFARAVCWALQQEKRVPMEHKDFTYRVEDWIRQETDIYRVC